MFLGRFFAKKEKPTVISFEVAGTYYRTKRDVNKAVRHLLQNDWYTDSFDLVLDADNPHDPSAVKVFIEDAHVGYVPASLSAQISDVILSESKVRGSCALINGSYYDLNASNEKSFDGDGVGFRINIKY